MAIDLRGKPIVITGASSGIGRATALACARAGMPVALNARGVERLEAVAGEVRALGVDAVAVAGDTSDGAVRTALLERAASLGPVFAVFANAGYGQEVAVLEMSDVDVRAMFEVNFFAGLEVVRAAGPGMLDRGSGHLVMCSSCLSKLGVPMYAAYCSTKACQDYFCRALRHELAGTGVAVSSVHPIGTKTEFFDRMDERSGGLKLASRSTAFMQPASVVGRAVVKRLRSGRGGEVWTSALMRTGLGLGVGLPWVVDRAMPLLMKARRRT